METTFELLALADDLTGALETGAFLAAAGIRTIVSTSPEISAGLPASALVVDAETRHLAPGAARERVTAVAGAARAAGARWLFKKTDSTLRGPIAAELAAVLEAWPGQPLTYIPAYPRLGRTVRNGSLLVDGLALEHTSFARDPRDPARTSSLIELLAREPALTVVPVAGAARLDSLLAQENRPVVYLCDAESQADLESLVAVLDRRRVLPLTAGTAALAEALAPVLPIARVPAPRVPRARTGLIVSGSLHPASLRQMEIARASANPGWELLSGHPGAMAAAVPPRLSGHGPESLVIFGGDTAYAILEALGVKTIEPLGELLPGVPASLIHADGCARPLITKAGGFGEPDCVARIIAGLGESRAG